MLEDDRHYFPVYDAAPVARAAVMLQYPAAAAAIRRLAGRVSAAEMRQMNFAVDGDRPSAVDAARNRMPAV